MKKKLQREIAYHLYSFFSVRRYYKVPDSWSFLKNTSDAFIAVDFPTTSKSRSFISNDPLVQVTTYISTFALSSTVSLYQTLSSHTLSLTVKVKLANLGQQNSTQWLVHLSHFIVSFTFHRWQGSGLLVADLQLIGPTQFLVDVTILAIK